MIFRQLFDQTSGHLLLSARQPPRRRGADHRSGAGEGRPLSAAGARSSICKLVKAVDTHLHADHITGLGALRDKTHCITVMGEQTKADVVSMRLADGDTAHHRGACARRDLHARPHRRFLQLHHAGPGVHRRHAAHPRHRPHRLPERRSARAVRVDLRPAAQAAGRDAGLSGARLQGRHGLHHRRGEGATTRGCR